MKTIALALLLVSATDERSLGIGLDVLPEAFATAAGRVSVVADLHLSTCTQAGCRWDMGHGVAINASLLAGSLSVERIEADWTAHDSSAPDAEMRYLNACLTIVTLVDPDLSSERRASTAEAIAMVSDKDVDIVRPILGLKFYGTRSSGGGIMRCGAVIVDD